jgi:hypothetical protein
MARYQTNCTLLRSEEIEMKRLLSTILAVIFFAMASSSMAQIPACSSNAPTGITVLAADAQPPSRENGTIDLANFVDIGMYYVQPYYQRKDPATGFMLGGKNPTALVKSLTQINGRSIADLEKEMRPGNMTLAGSVQGFLGNDESLLEVLAADNQTIVEELGLTHQELARHLHAIAALGSWLRHCGKEGEEFVYLGSKFKVSLRSFKGYQYSPFHDGTKTDTDMEIENVATGKKLSCSLLVPYMIERYGFYEGKGTRYRVDPREIIEVLDFLKAKIKTQQSADKLLSYGYSPAALKTWLGSERPVARQFHNAIAQEMDSKLTRIVRSSDVRPGELLAVKYADEN